MWTWPSQAGGCIFSSLHRVAHSTEHTTLPFRIQCNTYRSPLLFHVPQFPCHTLSFHTGKTKTVTGRKKKELKKQSTQHTYRKRRTAKEWAAAGQSTMQTILICSRVHCWFAAEYIADLQQSTLLICSRAHCWFAAEHIADLQQSTMLFCSLCSVLIWYRGNHLSSLKTTAAWTVRLHPCSSSSYLQIYLAVLRERERECVCVCVYMCVHVRACVRETERECALALKTQIKHGQVLPPRGWGVVVVVVVGGGVTVICLVLHPPWCFSNQILWQTLQKSSGCFINQGPLCVYACKKITLCTLKILFGGLWKP